MRTTTRTTTIRTAVTGAALAGLLAVAGCSSDGGSDAEATGEMSAPAAEDTFANLETVEAGGASVDVLAGMESYDPPEGYAGFWQTPEGESPQVTVGLAPDADPTTFVDDQLASMSGVMDDLEVVDQTDMQATFTGTGVDGATYTGIAAINGTVGVMVSAGDGLDEQVLQQIVDSAA
ncbi:hypothetical protein [Isoptericola sp. NPDC019482]|uniref:hypothetical protein n=1 Tax=Isoptericola sp. NPDC019482 TaxID=3154688 RepID=UPI00347E4DE4